MSCTLTLRHIPARGKKFLMRKDTHSLGPSFRIVDSKLPCYTEGQVYAWEAHLHRAYEEAAYEGETISYAERGKIVEDFVRKHKGDADRVVACEHCEKEIEEAMRSGVRRGYDAATVKAILEDFGVRNRAGRSTLRSKRNLERA